MSGRPFFHFMLAATLASAVTSVGVAQVATTIDVGNNSLDDLSRQEIAPMPREKARDPDAHTRKITLKECIEIALEQGNSGLKMSGSQASIPEIQRIQPESGTNSQGLMSQKNRLDIQINYLLANVEVSYWNLFAAYRNLYAQEEGLKKSFLHYRYTDSRVAVGSDPVQNRDQSRAQMERFRRTVIDARGQVQESERQLRGLLGMRSNDGMRLIPSDEPTFALIAPDFQKAADEAMANRPELLNSRLDLKAQQRKLVSVKELDNRDLVIATELTLKRSCLQLRDTELKVLEYLVQQYRQVIQTHADIGPAQAEREALQKYVAKIDSLISLGKWNAQDFLNYLTAQQQLATAIATESQAIANYKKAQATFEFAKGTIQKYNNLPTGE
ncbi:MAG TPA: TolC family protein [Gemmata sp.]|nr:TolC family protein [Gemmata sp.]